MPSAARHRFRLFGALFQSLLLFGAKPLTKTLNFMPETYQKLFEFGLNIRTVRH